MIINTVGIIEFDREMLAEDKIYLKVIEDEF